MPRASLGQYASLSFIVIGRRQRAVDRSQKSEERKRGFICGSGFQPRSYSFDDLPFTPDSWVLCCFFLTPETLRSGAWDLGCEIME